MQVINHRQCARNVIKFKQRTPVELYYRRDQDLVRGQRHAHRDIWKQSYNHDFVLIAGYKRLPVKFHVHRARELVSKSFDSHVVGL